MANVYIPALLRDLTGNREIVVLGVANVLEAIESLDRMFPGVRDRLCSGDGLRPGIAVAVNSQLVTLGLRQPLDEDSEVHFLPAIGGG